jgi:DNA-binding NarL/FixJ family response regulator
MPSQSLYNATPLDRILVIDDLPLIPIAFQEVFRTVNPSAKVEYSGNVFNALSARSYANTTFDLVITGSFAPELKKRFGQPRIMIYSSTYDPLIIEKMIETGIDAYVHKFESPEEIVKAYQQLAAGQPFVSGMFHTLYYDYGYGARK